MAENQEKLAYLLGAIYGDGSFTKDGKIFFSSTDFEFITEIAKIIKKLFNLEMNIRLRKLSSKNINWKDSFEFSSRRLYRILKDYNQKTVPDFINLGNLRRKALFLKGFFDAEGNVDFHKIKRKDGRIDTIRHVKCFSNNKKLLEQIKQLLRELKIKSAIFRSKGENYYVCIWNYKSLKQFSKFIGFVIKRKQTTLMQALNSYKEIQTRWEFNTYSKVMNLRYKKKVGAKRIKQKLSLMGIEIPQSTIESWIYGRNKIIENKNGGVM